MKRVIKLLEMKEKAEAKKRWKATDKTVAGERAGRPSAQVHSRGHTRLSFASSLSPPSAVVTSGIRDDAIPYLYIYRASSLRLYILLDLLYLFFAHLNFSLCLSLESSRCD